MFDGVLAPGRARLRRSAAAAAALAVCAAGVAGCTSTGSSGSGGSSDVVATGHTLTIYLSAPGGATADPVQQDVVDAERLAFAQRSGEVTAFRLTLAPLTASKISNDARSAIENTGAIAYLGEVAPGASQDSIGITNAEQLLQVSPTDTAAALTQTTPAVSGAPARYYESLGTYGRTFARVVPTTVAEARADARELQTLHVSSLYVADDGSPYGRALAASLKADAAGITVSQGPPSASQFGASGARALFFAGQSQAGAATLMRSVAAAHPGITLFGSSTLADPAFAARLGAVRARVYASTPGLLPHSLSSSGRTFVAAFQRAYHRAPLPQAIFGYEAASAVLDVLKQAGAAASNRGTVVRDFFAIRNRSSPLGAYSLDASGDTSLAPFVIEQLRSGRLVPIAQLSG